MTIAESPHHLAAVQTIERATGVLAIAGTWWVAQLASVGFGPERALADDLRTRGVGCYVPMEQVVRRDRGTYERPVFARYAFVAFEDDLERADYTDRDYRERRRISRWLEVRDQHRLRRELADLERVLGVDPTLSRLSGLEPGAWVEVVRGPLRGVRGRIDRVRRGTLHLVVAVLGRAAPVEIGPDMVELA